MCNRHIIRRVWFSLCRCRFRLCLSSLVACVCMYIGLLTVQAARSFRQPTELSWKIYGGLCTGSTQNPSCDDVCAPHTCDVNALSELTSEDRVAEVVRSVGKRCAVFSRFGKWFMRKFDGPWVHGETCGYVSGWFWRPNCSARSACGYPRVCPCARPQSPWKAGHCNILQRADIKWLIAQSPIAAPGNGDSCETACSKKGYTCFDKALEAIRDEQAMRTVVEDFNGLHCSGIAHHARLPSPDIWDGPWLQHGGLCGITEDPNWMANCLTEPVHGYHRICACLTGEIWNPSLCRNMSVPTTTTTTRRYDNLVVLD